MHTILEGCAFILVTIDYDVQCRKGTSVDGVCICSIHRLNASEIGLYLVGED